MKSPRTNRTGQGTLISRFCAIKKLIGKDGRAKGSCGMPLDLTDSNIRQRHNECESQLTKQTTLDLKPGELNFAEHCPLGVCRTDRDGYVMYGNDAWRAYYDFAHKQVPHVPQPWLQFVNDDDVQSNKDFFRALQTDPRSRACEFRLKNKTYTISEGGRDYTNDSYILATGFPKFGEDGTLKYIDFWVTDISAQKMTAKVLSDKMTEAIHLNNQQERFIDMISHEIRNPLSAVLHCGEQVVDVGHTALDTISRESLLPATLAPLRQMLKKQIDSTVDAAKTIMYCVQHQKQIVDDVLTLSKLDSDLLLVSPSAVELMSLVRSSLKMSELELKAADIALEIVEDDSLENLGAHWVMLDSKMFIQIIINLVMNAIKFTKKSAHRKITIKVSAHKKRPTSDALYGIEYVPHHYCAKTSTSGSPPIDINTITKPELDIFLSFSVTDTGIGLTDSQKIHLFNRFAQASPKTYAEYGGSGLGLFISRQITEMLDGQIGVSSTPGVGSTFAFYVRAQRTTRLTKANSAATTDGESSSSRNPNKPGTEETTQRSVLVVEDNIINQRVLCKQLKNHGFLVQAANHGKEALNAVVSKKTPSSRNRATSFDVILCDIEMPVMDGIEFTKEVRRLESVRELSGHVPIVGVTANVRHAQVNKTLESGMDGVTTKPYRVHELIEHINRCTQWTKQLKRRHYIRRYLRDPGLSYRRRTFVILINTCSPTSSYMSRYHRQISVKTAASI
ncbi:hypothetical protein FHL15_003132 [Xylaria flabelliformis]|uniref:Histidine kinase n=1 Tax=Xylaria flabelliformis TaxID=2512241 RepID=A0A553I706_9PEZI|nr:hypothetical protein FHL15_003132 [Xylaria flabelliformis]